MDGWIPLKSFHEWNITDSIPVGEIIVWDVGMQTDYRVNYDPEQHNPANGYTAWRKILEPPHKPLNILDVMKGILEGKSYRRPGWPNPTYSYPMHYLRNDPKKDYQLSRIDIMAEDWYEVEE